MRCPECNSTKVDPSATPNWYCHDCRSFWQPDQDHNGDVIDNEEE